MTRIWRRLKCVFAAALAAMLLAPRLGAVANLPDRLAMEPGGSVSLMVPGTLGAGVDAPEVAAVVASAGSALRVNAGEEGEAQLTLDVLGLPVRKVKLSVEPEKVLIPGGQSVGVAIKTAGVVVVGASDLGKTPSPARLAGLKSGDVIRSLDGTPVTSAAQLASLLTAGEKARLTVARDGADFECAITPTADARDGGARLGAWVRDSTAGVGTLTFYDPRDGAFGALGHAITDIDTGALMPVGAGEIYENRVVEVTRSREGTPGELTGDFFADARIMGEVTRNTDRGIFGEAGAIENPLYPEGLPIAPLREVRPGPASLLTTVEGGAVREYACEIVRLSPRQDSATRAMVIRVTDPALLERTGGIVQGMSGSPIIQDGHLIGAVTHVMVNDPAMGYAIGIEAMLEAAREAVEQPKAA